MSLSASRACLRAAHQVVDDRLRMDLLLDVERRRVDDEVGPVLPSLPRQTSCASESSTLPVSAALDLLGVSGRGCRSRRVAGRGRVALARLALARDSALIATGANGASSSACCAADCNSAVGMFFRLASLCVSVFDLFRCAHCFCSPFAHSPIASSVGCRWFARPRDQQWREFLLHLEYVGELLECPAAEPAEIVHASDPFLAHRLRI